MSGFDGEVNGLMGLDENAASQHLTYALGGVLATAEITPGPAFI
jgi:hypothetical protein